MAISDTSEETNKGIAYVSNTINDQTGGDFETGEEIVDAMVLVGRQFKNILKRIDRG